MYFTEENAIDVRRMLYEDRQVAYHQIEKILGFNALTILSILMNLIHVTKIFWKILWQVTRYGFNFIMCRPSFTG